MTTPPLYVSVAQAAAMLSVSRDFIYDLIAQGRLKAKKVNSIYRLSRIDVENVFSTTPRRTT